MKGNMYLENMFNSFLGGVEDEKMIFIRYFSMINLDEKKINEMAKEKRIDKVIFHRYKRGDMKSPFEPFIDVIGKLYRKFYSGLFSLEAFLKECGVYPLQVSAFASYIETGEAKRKEPAIPEEQTYEQAKAYESIINCLNYVASRHKVVIVLDKFQYANLSTIRVISKILDSVGDVKFKMFIAFNDKNRIKAYASEEFQDLIRIANKKKMVYEWHGYEVEGGEAAVGYFRPEFEHFHEYAVKVKNLYTLMALEDAEYYLNMIYVRIEEDKVNVDVVDKFELYSIGASNYLLMNNPKSALLIAEKLCYFEGTKERIIRRYVYNHLCALSYIFLLQNNNAEEYIENCKKISEEADDDDMRFYAMLLEITSEYGAWHSIFNVNFEKLKYDEEKAKRLEERGFYNVLARYYSYGSDNTEEEILNIIEKGMSEPFKKAIAIGERLNNNNFLLSVNTKYISRFTDLGYYDYASNFYEEKLKILNREGNKRRMANQMLGLGYNSMIAEEYIRAGKYFDDAIGILYGLKESEAIGEALYNLAMNSICAMDFESATRYLQLTFRILENLNVESIVICNPAKLYGLLGLSYYHIGNDYKSYMNLGTMKVLIRGDSMDECKVNTFRRDEDMFYYHYLNGCLQIGSGKLESACDEFKKARKYYENSPGVKACMVACYMGDYYVLLKEMGKDDEAYYVMQSAIDYCKEHNYTKKLEMLKNVEEFGEQIHGEKLPDFISKVSEEDILEMTYGVGRENQLVERKRDIRFLSMLQEVIGRDDVDVADLIINAVKLMCNNFDMDEVLLLNKDDSGRIEVLHLSDGMKIKNDYEDIFAYFSKNKNEFYLNRINNDMYEYKEIMDIFYTDDMQTFMCVPVFHDNTLRAVFVGIVNQESNVNGDMKLFEDDNLAILKTATIQLIAGVDRLRNRIRMEQINDRLNEMAITDMLTGLYNRQGFSKMIDQMENHKHGAAILYIDLDNFKYCNDTFGHDVGDLVLKKFSEVLEEVANSNGYAVRYGGDEFIIVLNDADVDMAVAASKEIYDKIQGGFVSDIEEYLGEKIDIEDDRRIMTSIGIAIAEDCKRSTIIDTLKKADDMLYGVKRNGKGNYKIWT